MPYKPYQIHWEDYYDWELKIYICPADNCQHTERRLENMRRHYQKTHQVIKTKGVII